MKLSAALLVSLAVVSDFGSALATLDRSNWMKSVRDDVLVKNLLVPGTHDSCSTTGHYVVKCQDSNVQQQLQRGIRYLGMRVGGCQDAPGRLCMYHGSVYMDMNFDEPKDKIYAFLRDHPSEAIFMQFKHEHYGQHAETTPQAFQSVVDTNYLTGHHEWFLSGKVEAANLRMQDVRGRTVLFWNDDSTNTRKYGSVQEWLSCSRSVPRMHPAKDGWFENPTSCVIGAVPDPRNDTARVLPLVQRYFDANPKTKGIISIDFPTEEIIVKLLELNTPFYKP